MATELPHLGRLPAQQVVLVPVETGLATMGERIHAALEGIGRALREQGIQPAGPWFAHHHRRPTDTFAFDVCMPVERAVSVSGEMQMAHFPEMLVVRTAYHGAYDGLPDAWRTFVAWVHAKGHHVRDDFFEVYSIGSQETAEAEAWQTDLILPLVEDETTKGTL